MSTRSAFGTLENGRFKGRYIHSDGYPSYNGTQLVNLIKRDGLEQVLKVMTEDHYGWSSLNPDLPELTDEIRAQFDNPKIDYRSAAYRWAILQPGQMYGDGRFVGVPGYGIAYTTVEGQSDPSEWVEFNIGDAATWGIEWAYGIETIDSQPHFVVIEIRYSEPHTVVRDRIPLETPVESFFTEELLSA